jgi:hypothetical protein
MADLTLAPAPYQTVLDNAGNLVPNACIWTYVAGTTTPAATYSDALGTPNTNPIRADAAGRYTAYLVPGAGYLFVVEQPATPPAHGAVIRTQDNVVGVPAAPAVTTGTWLPDLGGTTTYTAREGSWARLGPLVFARGSIHVNVLGTGTPAQIAGLPFVVAGETAGAVGGFFFAAAPVVSVALAVNAGTSAIQVLSLPAAAPSLTQPAFFTNGTILSFAITYLTADP